jgi:hypothetical protein
MSEMAEETVQAARHSSAIVIPLSALERDDREAEGSSSTGCLEFEGGAGLHHLDRASDHVPATPSLRPEPRHSPVRSVSVREPRSSHESVASVRPLSPLTSPNG